MKRRCDHCSCNCNLSSCELNPKQIFRASVDLNPWPLRLCCSGLPTELWRPIQWAQANLLSSSQPVKGMKHRMKVMWTAEIQMKQRCDHRNCLNCDYNCDGHIFISFVFLQLTSFSFCDLRNSRNCCGTCAVCVYLVLPKLSDSMRRGTEHLGLQVVAQCPVKIPT